MPFSESECRALARATKNMAKMGHKTAATKAGYRNLAIMYKARADDLKRHREVKSDFDHWQKVHKKTAGGGAPAGEKKK